MYKFKMKKVKNSVDYKNFTKTKTKKIKNLQ